MTHILHLRHIIATVLLMASVVSASAQHTFTHPWAGKRVAWLGDSVTDPAATGIKDKYWTFLAQWLGIKPLVYAVNGRQWDDIPRQADELWKQHADNVDAIVILMGTNDFNSGVPIGRWFDEEPADVEAAAGRPKALCRRIHRTPVTGNATFRARINTALAKLKDMYPSKQIVLLTPLHRAFAQFSNDNVQPDESYQNSCGEYVDAYMESVREASRIWAVPLIDLATLSGMYPLSAKYAPWYHDAANDMLHPNAEGHKRLALTLYYQLATLPIY